MCTCLGVSASVCLQATDSPWVLDETNNRSKHCSMHRSTAPRHASHTSMKRSRLGSRPSETMTGEDEQDLCGAAQVHGPAIILLTKNFSGEGHDRMIVETGLGETKVRSCPNHAHGHSRAIGMQAKVFFSEDACGCDAPPP